MDISMIRIKEIRQESVRDLLRPSTGIKQVLNRFVRQLSHDSTCVKGILRLISKKKNCS